MTSKERVRAALSHKPVDRVPAAFEGVGTVAQRLMERHGLKNMEELYQKFDIDIRYASPDYIGPKLASYINEKGNAVHGSYWGYETEQFDFGEEKYGMTSYFPLNNFTTIEEVEAYKWPDPDWFDYTAITKTCEEFPDKAIVIGHEGPFQFVTFLISMDNFFILMIDEPEVAQRILDKMVEFELEFYDRCFKAGKGMIDVLRPHDDYGTQISTLFSIDMWREFFEENTKKLVELTHKYNAFYQQHSCGAVAPMIPELIRCNVDSLEPLQAVEGLEPETLQAKYGGKITFHGGIDTQDILPHGTVAQVRAETERYIKTLNKSGGYILMASQGFENDVPLENIDAVYLTDRTTAI